MKTFTSVLIFSFLFFKTAAQQHEIDSLIDGLKNFAALDSNRAKQLSNIAFAYSEFNPEEGLKYADKGIELSLQLKDSVRIVEAYMNKGLNYYGKSDYSNAIKYYKAAQDYLPTKGMEDKSFILRNTIANAYLNLSKYTDALNSYFDNLHFAERLNKNRGMAITLGNIGLVYKRTGDYKKSLEYNYRSLAMHLAAKNSKSIADAFNHIGSLHDVMGNADSALYYYQNCIAIAKENNYLKGVASATANIGVFYRGHLDFIKANEYLKAALAEYEKMGDLYTQATILSYLGDNIFDAPDKELKQMGYSPATRTQTALGYFKKSLSISEEIEDVAGQADQWEEFTRVYKKQNNFEKALEAYEKFIVLRDSVINDEKKETIRSLEMNFNFEKKEDSINVEREKDAIVAKAEILRQSAMKRSILIGGVLFFIAAVISFVFYKRRRDAKQLLKEAEYKAEVSDTEMKALRAQMNPHFIFNSLNSINDYVSKNNIPEAEKYLSKFAKLMRMILENSEQADVPLKDDLRALELYMQLEALRMNHKFDFAIKVDESIDQEQTMVPPLILQPFVENSILHGFSGQEEKGDLQIIIKKDGDMINCIVDDNGVGRNSATGKENSFLIEKKSMGMKITLSRIDILNRRKNTNAAVSLTDKEKGTRVEVKLPLTLQF